MKRIAIIAAIASLFTMGSCHQDWVCHCVNQDGDSFNYDQNDQTLSQARSECKGRNYDNTTLGIHTSLDCSLQ